MIKLAAAIVVIAFIVEWALKPRLDKTSEGWWLLWYGRNTRNYIKLFKQNTDE